MLNSIKTRNDREIKNLFLAVFKREGVGNFFEKLETLAHPVLSIYFQSYETKLFSDRKSFGNPSKLTLFL